MKRWGGGSPWLIAAVLGQWDWGPQIAPPPKRKEGKKGKSKARNSSTPCGRDTQEIRGGVLPCLCPFPLFSASSIPVSSEQGSWPSLYLVSFCLSSHLTYFPFGRCRRWRLISVTVTVAFPLDLVVFASSYHLLQHNISLQQMHLSLSLKPNSHLSTLNPQPPTPTSRVPQLPAQLHSCAHRRLITAEPSTSSFP